MDGYHPDALWMQIAGEELGVELARQLTIDLPAFCQLGLEQLSENDKQQLRQRYQPYRCHPAVIELLDWLDGRYQFDPACLTD